MGKLPKSMREKQAQARALRQQGSKHKKSLPKQAKGLNRQQKRQMQQQGMENMEEIPANRVIIQTDEEDLVINDVQVIKVVQQGMEVYQVIGKAESQAPGSAGGSASGSAGAEDAEWDDVIENVGGEGSGAVEEELTVEITEADIQLVAMQTGASPEEAKAALSAVNGDLARAIMNLKTR